MKSTAATQPAVLTETERDALSGASPTYCQMFLQHRLRARQGFVVRGATDDASTSDRFIQASVKADQAG
ncbi:MAG: hypothetical protein AAFV53_26000 [Myxococcota bacterium]